MEELLVKINYLIREKLWCSIRTLCDDVSSVKYIAKYSLAQSEKLYTSIDIVCISFK